MTGSPYGPAGSGPAPQNPGAPWWQQSAQQPLAPQQPYPPQYGSAPTGYPPYGAAPQGTPPYAQPYSPAPQPYSQHPVGPQATPPSTFAPRPAPTQHIPAPGSAPIGPAKPASASIDSYKPPKRKVGTLIAFLVGFALMIGAFIAIDHFSRGTTTSSDSPSATATQTLPGLEFVSPSSKGVWQITDTTWSSDHVTVTISLTVTSGTLRYTFYAYTNSTAKVSYPDSASSSVLAPGILSTGQSAQGTLTLRISRGDATLILADSTDTPVSGLAIKA